MTARLGGRPHRSQFATARLAECLERILISRPNKIAHFLNGKIGREVLLGDEVQRSFRLREHGIGGAKPNAIEQRIHL